jgi:hypothetical protein
MDLDEPQDYAFSDVDVNVDEMPKTALDQIALNISEIIDRLFRLSMIFPDGVDIEEEITLEESAPIPSQLPHIQASPHVNASSYPIPNNNPYSSSAREHVPYGYGSTLSPVYRSSKYKPTYSSWTGSYLGSVRRYGSDVQPQPEVFLGSDGIYYPASTWYTSTSYDPDVQPQSRPTAQPEMYLASDGRYYPVSLLPGRSRGT